LITYILHTQAPRLLPVVLGVLRSVPIFHVIKRRQDLRPGRLVSSLARICWRQGQRRHHNIPEDISLWWQR